MMESWNLQSSPGHVSGKSPASFSLQSSPGHDRQIYLYLLYIQQQLIDWFSLVSVFTCLPLPAYLASMTALYAMHLFIL